MFAIILGLAIGLLTVIPLGPLSMTIIGVAADRGPVSGIQAALGVVGADVLLGSSTVAVVVAGQTLPGPVFSALQAVSAAVVVGFGFALIVKVRELHRLVGRIQRPAPTLFVMSVVSPAVGSWLAILLASPFTEHADKLMLFAAGIVVASLLWHSALGALAGHFASSLTQHRLLGLARIGGVSMVGLGLAMFAL